MPVIVTKILSFFTGVPIFFALSGFLLWHSIDRSKRYLNYIKKRFWRIYPELWVGVLVEIITIICLYSDFIHWSKLFVFAITQGTILQFWTPEFLRGYGCGTPNGSLWTICVLIQFYIIVWAVYKLLRGKKPYIWAITLITFIAISAVSPLMQHFVPTVIYKLYKQSVIPYFWLFLIGIIASEFYDIIIPFLKKYWFVFAVISCIVIATKIDISASYGVVKHITQIAAVLGFAYCFPKLNVKTDISYGIYIYHMIVINVMIVFGFINKVMYLFVAILITCISAYISTKTVGKYSARKK